MEMERKRAALHNLGCKVNAYETEAMRQLLENAGYEIVPFSEPADVYVVNTCTVTNTADKKSRQMLHRARALNPDAVVVAAGCYAQVAPERTASDPAVDLVIGSREKEHLVTLLKEYEKRHPLGDKAGKGNPETGMQQPVPGRDTLLCVPDVRAPGQLYEPLSVDRPANHTRAFVKVQDGCDKFCSYCVIPYARGRAVSRAAEDVLREVETLARNGFREIVLTGIHLSSYGRDLGTSLTDLIRMVHGVDKIARIRLSSLEPGIVTEEFAREIAALPKVCPQFHLSLQSGSDAVLHRMNRHYTAAEYLEKCEILRRHYENPALTTDVIVGFPGETEEEFAETCAFVRQVAFSRIHIFPYSRRDGTAAARMPGQITNRVKEERAKELSRVAEELAADYLTRFEGQEVEVLFEEPTVVDGKQQFQGFTPEQVRVRVQSEEDLCNEIRKVVFFSRNQ